MKLVIPLDSGTREIFTLALTKGTSAALLTSKASDISAIAGLVTGLRLDGETIIGEVHLLESATTAQRHLIAVTAAIPSEIKASFCVVDAGMKGICIEPK